MSQPTASLQWTAGVLRVHVDAEGHWRNRSAYEWACHVRVLSDSIVELMGVDKPLTFAQARAVKKALAAEGFEWMQHWDPEIGAKLLPLQKTSETPEY